MVKYACPECGSSMVVRSSHGRCFISCACGISHAIPDDAGEPNTAFLKFLHIMDRRTKDTGHDKRDKSTGTAKPLKAVQTKTPATQISSTTTPTTPVEPTVTQKSNTITDVSQRQPATTTDPPRCRPKADIVAMIKGKNPDKITRNLLFTQEYYVCQYVVSDSSGPEPGQTPHQLTINPKLAKYLENNGISNLYKFQQESYDAIISGKDVVVVAPTASGKTESFLIPIIQMSSEAKSPMFALIVYPTKALAKDQLAKIQTMAASMGVRVAIFDGDTPYVTRERILKSPPHILITNFDVINYHLPRQSRFAELLYNVRILVVDEVHTYSGIFGSNVHHLIKRLDRVCMHPLQMVAASATINEPVRFCSALLDRDVELIKTDQRRGRIDIIMMSASDENKRDMILHVTRQLISQKHKTLVFSNSHRGAELISLNAKRSGLDVSVHRSGIPVQERHKIEDRFKNGGLMAISCTPTLELGIDIGAVDGVVSSLVPVNRLLQRVGRAARRDRRGYAVLALGNDPMSTYYERNPQDYFEDAELLYIDPTNPIVQEYHVAAMSLDAPLRINDVPLEHRPAIQRCADAGLVQNRDGNIIPMRDKIYRQLEEYSIRGMGESIRIMIDGRAQGTRALPMALNELHTGATYYMSGLPYEVINLDVSASKMAHLKTTTMSRPSTHPHSTKNPTIVKIHDTKTMWNTQIAHCTLSILQTVSGYYTKDRSGKEELTLLDTPHSYDFITKGLVFCVPMHDTSTSDEISPSSDASGRYSLSACHAVEHVIIEGGNMIIGGVAQDMGGISLGGTGAIFVYDGAVGGNGATRTLYDKIEMVIERSAQILRQCPCESDSGCPQCTYSYRCGLNNEQLNKPGALKVLESIMHGDRGRLEDGFGNQLYDM